MTLDNVAMKILDELSKSYDHVSVGMIISMMRAEHARRGNNIPKKGPKMNLESDRRKK